MPGAFLALLTLPLFWTLFLGQIDGLVLLGVSGLPWLVPLALLKPQLAIFASLARKSYLAASLGFLGLSFLIWGFWPLRLFTTMGYYQEFPQDIALKWWGIPLALVLLWFSRGDVDMLVAAGAFGTLHLVPYNLLLITPAISRLKPWSAAIACLLTWLPLSANWLGPRGLVVGLAVHHLVVGEPGIPKVQEPCAKHDPRSGEHWLMLLSRAGGHLHPPRRAAGTNGR